MFYIGEALVQTQAHNRREGAIPLLKREQKDRATESCHFSLCNMCIEVLWKSLGAMYGRDDVHPAVSNGKISTYYIAVKLGSY